MQLFDIRTARSKVLADIRAYIIEVQRIVRSPVETIKDGIRTLVDLRRASYEDLNQIQHEYAAICAIEWIIANRRLPEGISWKWNPRQTGGADEPDICAMLDGETIISGEVTTSPVPKGYIDSRMKKTLGKLATMKGQRFYFVLSSEMADRACAKIRKAGYEIELVQLLDGSAASLS